MQIKQDPVTRLWCREDGAVLMPPSGIKFRKFRWTFGSCDTYGYCKIKFHGKDYKVHQIICRTFHGLAPEGKPFVDHINRIKNDNRCCNLRYASYKENSSNADRVDKSIEKYGVRRCDDRKAYNRVHSKDYYERHREELRAYWAAKRAEKKAQGFTMRKGPNGKQGWHPRIRT